MSNAIELTRELVQIDTAGAHESTAAAALAERLDRQGVHSRIIDLECDRASLVAQAPQHPVRGSVLTLSGHLDTVPAEPVGWSSDPWSGEIREGHIYGRGTSDMKSGIAAMVCAYERHLAVDHQCRGVQLVLTAAEETGCQGAMNLSEAHLSRGGPLFVAEPTANRLALGHKGVLWLRLETHGRAAHGSRPDLGVNAVTQLARAAIRLEDDGSRPAHEDGTAVTLNIGTFVGGVQTNLVPDSAAMTVDLRTTAGLSSDHVRRWVERVADLDAATLVDLPPVQTHPSDPVARSLTRLLEDRFGIAPALRVPMAYFTDASVLVNKLDSQATVLLGPGDPEQAHTADERCEIAAIDLATDIYTSILDMWCASEPEAAL